MTSTGTAVSRGKKWRTLLPRSTSSWENLLIRHWTTKAWEKRSTECFRWEIRESQRQRGGAERGLGREGEKRKKRKKIKKKERKTRGKSRWTIVVIVRWLNYRTYELNPRSKNLNVREPCCTRRHSSSSNSPCYSQTRSTNSYLNIGTAALSELTEKIELP